MMSECGVFDKLKELACSVSTGSANGEYQILIWKACCGNGGELEDLLPNKTVDCVIHEQDDHDNIYTVNGHCWGMVDCVH
jgi:hypothetical protein